MKTNSAYYVHVSVTQSLRVGLPSTSRFLYEVSSHKSRQSLVDLNAATRTASHI